MRALMPMMICTAVISSVSSRLIAAASADIYLGVSGEKLICLGNVPMEKTVGVPVNAIINFGGRIPPHPSLSRNYVSK